MAWLRVIHKRAAKVGREMDALLDALKDIDPEVAKSYALLDAIKDVDPEVAKSGSGTLWSRESEWGGNETGRQGKGKGWAWADCWLDVRRRPQAWQRQGHA
ncbi:hypothetical protein CRG98_017193 [Punica granatum]|uniref:Uncharacterized protein n=1 Tax=Punica granatum TaxID=22663 RepID=A0A2I0K1E7_PUNGR|nr:hypothetical protein CRG98_017193 [Punica granatum]